MFLFSLWTYNNIYIYIYIYIYTTMILIIIECNRTPAEIAHQSDNFIKK